MPFSSTSNRRDSRALRVSSGSMNRAARCSHSSKGTRGSTAFPAALRAADGLARLGAFIRSFHDAVGGFDPGEDAVFRVGRRPLRPGEIVCHGDLGYWNTVWREGAIVGVIDRDTAGPAPAV